MPSYCSMTKTTLIYLRFAPSKEKKEYRVSRAAEARKLKYEPDKKCGGEAGFSQDDRSLTGRVCERMGMLPPLPSRWNKDGTWNW